jgi:hypothetical protein
VLSTRVTIAGRMIDFVRGLQRGQRDACIVKKKKI